MEKGILLLENDPEIKAFTDDLDEMAKAFQEKMMFMKKQLETANNEHQAAKKEVWIKIRDACEKKSLLPKDYSEEKYFLRYDKNVLYCGEHDEEDDKHPLEKLVNFLKGMHE